MADDPNLDLDPDDAGLAFRAEMWATDTLMRYWRQLSIAIAVTLAAVFLFGQWGKYHRNNQRSTTSAIADVESELPKTLTALAYARAGIQGDATDIDESTTRDTAGRLLEIAKNASGTSRVEAALKSAELYRLIDATAEHRAALDLASETATGVLRYAAIAGLANLDIEEGEIEPGLERFRSLQGDAPYLARQATLDIAAALEALERFDEAVVAYDKYLTSWPEASDIEDVRQLRETAAGKAG